MADSPGTKQRVSLSPRGLLLGDREVPLISGSIHYFRLDPREWLAALSALQSLGIEIVDVYLPWGVHEQVDGSFDFGLKDPRLDVVRFLRQARDLGMLAIVRPGPHINAELTFFGIPERVIWNRDCQARSPRGKPVVLPVPPLAFPVPSYASEAFLEESDRWLGAVGVELAPLIWPNGPIVMCQIDNEGALYFRDGVYDQDHHPDAVATYRGFLLDKYGSLAKIREVLSDPGLELDTLNPPARLSGKSLLDLARHLDAAEAQEEIIARAFLRMKNTLALAGVRDVPTIHNLPFGEGSTPLDPERVNRVVDLVGLDYYHNASETTRAEIARRTSDLRVRAAARGYVPFACELGAGFPPFFPPITEADSAFTALATLAYGLRGFNVYMAVERDRWIGAPIDRHGRRRPFADFWEQLVGALERLNFFGLHVDAAVHVVVPRNVRRLARVLHAFGPITLAAFHVSGGSAEHACFEDDFGSGRPFAIDAAEWLRKIEDALSAERIPFAIVAGDLIEQALAQGKWTLVACAGGLEAEIRDALRRGNERGAAISMGPLRAERDAVYRPLPAPFAVPSIPGVPDLFELDETALRAAVRAAKATLDLPSFECSPENAFISVHRDDTGAARVAFVLNPSARALRAEIVIPGITRAVDALDGTEYRAKLRALELPLEAQSARMLELFP
ncbi:MAG TPA: beta-galactosidase [Polyangiaceae bacterium]|jgi:beta-galactosidase|nr:beta-galactosidase [Polyangiaceae bacterium]